MHLAMPDLQPDTSELRMLRTKRVMGVLASVNDRLGRFQPLLYAIVRLFEGESVAPLFVLKAYCAERMQERERQAVHPSRQGDMQHRRRVVRLKPSKSPVEIGAQALPQRAPLLE